MSEGGDSFGEKVIAGLIEEGLTISWRYGYRLANRYEVKRVCAGGMGIVFIVEDLMEGAKRYAAKTLKAYFRKPATESEWERWRDSANSYLRECNVWVDLGKHRHIVQAEYLEKIEGAPLVMSEFIDGGSLDAWLEKGPLDMITALDFAIQSCIGMEYANKKGVAVHRDIKPGNILVTRDGVAKINDFGIAKAVESAETIRPKIETYAALDSESLLVSRGMGTPPYMAPEQFHRPLLSLVGYPTIPLGVETDIYAFGLVLYEMLTGKLVAQIESDRETEIQRAVQNIISMPGVNPGYDLNDWAKIVYCFLKTLKTIPPKPSRNERLNAAVLKCLEKDPSNRYHTFTELKEELMQIYREETGREYHVVDEPAYESSWRNRAKTCWLLGREKESFECYDRALEQNPNDTITWLEKGLASAEAGDLGEFGLCLEMISYLKPSRKKELQQYKERILNEDHIRLRDIKLFDRFALEYAISERVRNWVSSVVEQELTDPFRELNPVVLKALKELEDEKRYVREDAAQTLGKLGDRAAVPALIRALKDEHHMVRMYAVMSLRQLGDRSAVPALIQALKDKDSSVRMDAAQALGKLGDRAAVPALIEALKDDSEYVRSYAASALESLGDRSAVPALVEALKDKDSWVRTRSALALGRLGDKSALPVLVETLKDKDERVRGDAAWTVGELGDTSAVPALVEALKDERSSVGMAAAKALGRLGDKSALPVLVKALKDKDEYVREGAALALGDLGEREAVPALIEALKDEKAYACRFAAGSLTKLGDKRAVFALVEALKDERFFVRTAVAEALGDLGDRSAVPALIQALKDKDHMVREDAAQALGKLGDRAAVPALIEALKDKVIPVRESVSRALGDLGDRAAVPALMQALKDDFHTVRRQAAVALGKSVDKQTIPKLLEAFTSFSEPIHALVALRWACFQGDKVKLSWMKDKVKAYSAFEWNKRGSELTAQNEYDKALECFEKAVEIDPDWEVPKKTRDKCLKNVNKRRVEPAIDELEEAVPASIETQKAKLEGVEGVDWLRKGTALFNLGKYAEAMECYDKALEIDSRYVDAWYCKGIILNRLGKHQEAIECFDRAVKIDPAHGLSWYNMGYALSKLNRREEAIQCYDRALNIDQRDVDAWYSKGYHLATLGRYEKAIQCYDMTLKINPRYAYAWAGKGIALHQLGKRKEAMKCLHKALEIDPSLRENLASLLASE